MDKIAESDPIITQRKMLRISARCFAAQVCSPSISPSSWSCSVSSSSLPPCSPLTWNLSWAHLGPLVLGPPVALRMMNRALPRKKLPRPRPRLSTHLNSVSPSLSSCWREKGWRCVKAALTKVQIWAKRHHVVNLNRHWRHEWERDQPYQVVFSALGSVLWVPVFIFWVYCRVWHVVSMWVVSLIVASVPAPSTNPDLL